MGHNIAWSAPPAAMNFLVLNSTFPVNSTSFSLHTIPPVVAVQGGCGPLPPASLNLHILFKVFFYKAMLID